MHVFIHTYGYVVLAAKDWAARKDALLAFGTWEDTDDGECKAIRTPELDRWLQTKGIQYRTEIPEAHTHPTRVGARLKSVKTWYEHDWMKLDPKLRTSCVEGISSFLSLFDMEDVAAIFCPKAPPVKDEAIEAPQWEPREEGGIRKHLPPLDELIESGKVLALNMPAGSNPALARAVGVFLKNAWLQTLLRRPAQMKADSKRYFRPAVFICDEYQSFASVGEDDPSDDEKAFALTRQCRVIPIVATQSISSLRSVLGTSEAWRTLLQTLRTRIFLSPQRRRQRRDRLETVRAGGQDQAKLDRHRIRAESGSLAPVRQGRRRSGIGRNQQVIPGTTRGFVSAERVCLASQLPGDLPAL